MRATHVLAVLFACAAGALAASEPAKDPDLFWHLASGRWMLEHGRLLDRDVFSFTREGAQYTSGQWLGQVVLALAYRLGSWPGIELLRAALVAGATLFLSRAVLRVQPHAGWAALPIVVAILVSRLAWGDRPQLFTLLLFPVFLDLLLRARLGGGSRALWVLPALALLWANLHGAFILGLALLAAFALEAQLARHPERRRFAIVLAASVGAAALNPSGLIALTWASSYAGSLGQRITEERPTDVLSPAGALYALLLVVSLASALVLGRRGIAERVGPPLLWAGLVAPLALLGLAIQRQLPYACDVLAVFAAAAVPAALRRPPAVAPLLPLGATRVALVALVGGAVALAASSARPAPDLAAYPAGAIGELRARPGNLLHEYDWGGYLIHAAPEKPTFIDGRLFPFVPRILDEWWAAVAVRPGYDGVLDRHDIALVLLRPHRPLVSALRDRGWDVVGEEDGRWILLARP